MPDLSQNTQNAQYPEFCFSEMKNSPNCKTNLVPYQLLDVTVHKYFYYLTRLFSVFLSVLLQMKLCKKDQIIRQQNGNNDSYCLLNTRFSLIHVLKDREEYHTSFMCNNRFTVRKEEVGRFMNNAKGGEQLFGNRTASVAPFRHLLYHLTWYSRSMCVRVCL